MTLFFMCLWVVLSVFILGIFVWTTRALQDQKRVWAEFATRRGLQCDRGTYFKSNTVRGKIGPYGFYLASEQRDSADLRGRTFVTVIQFEIPGKMPAPGVLASGNYREYASNLVVREALLIDHPGFSPDRVVARADHAVLVAPYFTPDRLRVLDSLIKQKGLSVLFLFDIDAIFLRLETVDPMLKSGQLDKTIDGILPMLQVLASD